MRTVKIGLVGCGTVGGGVVKILNEHAARIERQQGVRIELAKATSRTRSKMEALGLTDNQIVDSYQDIINDPEIDIVVELVGGTGLAADVIIEALEAGKNVVTANKAVMASRWNDVFAAAQKGGGAIGFEGSVGGGIPILLPVQHQLTGNRIESVLGIVNGTTNYMLTRIGEGLSYDDALKEAQDKGFAEADPTADVDGHDAAAKIAILASVAFNTKISIDQVHTEGIRSISPIDLKTASDMGYAVKLLAIAHRTNYEVEIRVHPTMLPKAHPLASVNGVYNAIFVHGDSVGDTMFYGEGAGSGPAASAVMGDVIEIARHISLGIQPAPVAACPDEVTVLDMGELNTRYYLRLTAYDKPGALAQISEAFGREGVSVRSMLQDPGNHDSATIIFVTHHAREAALMKALDAIRGLPVTKSIDTVIRIEEPSS